MTGRPVGGAHRDTICARRCAPRVRLLGEGKIASARRRWWRWRWIGCRGRGYRSHWHVPESRFSGAIRSEGAAAEHGGTGTAQSTAGFDVLRERLCGFSFVRSGADRFANAVVRRAGFDVLPLERMSGQVDELKGITQPTRV
jgi:hypothetical protein